MINALIFFIVALAFRKLSPSLVQAQSTLLVPAKISLSQALKQNFGALYHQHTLFYHPAPTHFVEWFFWRAAPYICTFYQGRSPTNLDTAPPKISTAFWSDH